PNSFRKPESLYAAQLAERTGRRTPLMSRATKESTNPTLDEAAELIAASRKPAPLLIDFIAAAWKRNPIPSEPGNAKRVEEISLAPGFSQVSPRSNANSTASAVYRPC